MAQVPKAVRGFRPRSIPSTTNSTASIVQQQETARRNSSDVASGRLFIPHAAPVPFTSPRLSSSHDAGNKSPPPLSKMSTPTLLRSLMLNYIMASPILRVPCMGVLRLAATSKLAIFNPEKNFILGSILYATAYKQFCAGRNQDEVRKTIAATKDAGFRGVVLCYGREVVLDKSAQGTRNTNAVQYHAQDLQNVRRWREGLIRTLECIGPGDILAIKFTGAGQIALDALKAGQSMPEVLKDAMDAVCEQATRQGSRLWLDAEQAILQNTIDSWAIDLMRRYNRDGKVLVSNTIQSYLKSARDNVHRHLRLAAEEGWAMGIKLVRGAYIESDPRHLLHDSIEETHQCFDTIAEELIEMKMPSEAGVPAQSSQIKEYGLSQQPAKYPKVQLFIATHNSNSVRRAQAVQRRRLEASQPTVNLEFGQLQGMADEISYELVQQAEQMLSSSSSSVTKDREALASSSSQISLDTTTTTTTPDVALGATNNSSIPEKTTQHQETIAVEIAAAAAPKAFKYLTWGTLSECLGYLHRRAVENRGAIERTRDAAHAMTRELKRRVLG